MFKLIEGRETQKECPCKNLKGERGTKRIGNGERRGIGKNDV